MFWPAIQLPRNILTRGQTYLPTDALSHLTRLLLQCGLTLANKKKKQNQRYFDVEKSSGRQVIRPHQKHIQKQVNIITSFPLISPVSTICLPT